jgi:hypothetical protein
MNEGLKIGHDMAELAAEKCGDDWKESAYDAFVEYAKSHTFFTTEDVRKSRPDIFMIGDNRAWGSIARRAAKNEIVEHAGVARAKSLAVHGVMITKWRSLIYDLENEFN